MRRQRLQDGLHTLRLPQSGHPPLDVVAVHGLNGDCVDTWTDASKPGSATLWLKDLLPEKLPGVRVMTFQYDSSVVGSTSVQGVRDSADKLISFLRDEREEYEDEKRPIVFVGHSLGGIVIKQALTMAKHKESAFSDIAKCTKGIVFFGTPHRGADAANWATSAAAIASAACGRPRSEFLKTLQTNSADLLKISEDFRPFASQFAIVSFYEEHAYAGMGTVIVDKYSAIMGLAHEETMMLGGTHSSMCKFGRDDKRFDAVWRRIRRAAKGPVH